MNIKTKYDIGNEVYYIGNGTVKKLTINLLKIVITSETVYVEYWNDVGEFVVEDDAYHKAKDILKDIENKIKDLDKVK